MTKFLIIIIDSHKPGSLLADECIRTEGARGHLPDAETP